MTTTCESCDNVVLDTRKRQPTQWLCIKFPRENGGSFVSTSWWVEYEPYMKCVGINGGRCPFWTERRKKGDHNADSKAI